MAKSRPNLNWIGQTVGGRYKIEDVLGQGGMSAVYKATDPNLRRTVAVKLIHPHLSSDPEFVRRFEQEAAAVAQLRHANIIQVYDFNHDDNLYYMVLEFVPGHTLQSKLAALDAAKQRLPLDDSVRIMATVCDAVAYAHQQGMIHRDLKPANVMLTPKGEPILMDFGVAKMLGGTQHTATGAIVGTAKYMSPEQARGERPDERTDIYSLGVMLYELVAGQPPFDADTTVAVLMQHVTQPVPDIRQLRSDTPEELVAIIEKALAKKPDDRFQTASDMAAALQAIQSPARTIVGSEQLESTQVATPAQRRQFESALPSSAVAARPPVSVSPAAQPAKSGGQTLWIAGAVAAVIVLLVVAGAIFFFARGDGSAEEGQGDIAVAMAEGQELPSAEGMVKIEAGTYTVGLDPSDNEHAAAQRVDLAEFWIDRYEVTNEQYAVFLSQADRQAPADWVDGSFPSDQEKHPVKGVTWDQAGAYCEWVGKRLPNEAEWEVAVRGVDGRLYPWGNDLRAVELPRSGTYEVGGKPTNQTPSGLFDMAGNVWEWVGDTYAPVADGNRVLRGGANGFIKDMAYRLQGNPNQPTMFATAGIRCAASNVTETTTKVVQLEEGVLYQDTFADPGSGWPVLAEGSQFFGYHPPDFYHIELSEPDKHITISRPPNFEDITVEAEVQVDFTDTENGSFRYGLVIRQVELDEYYVFTVSYRDETWEVFKNSPAGREVLSQGSVNTLKGFAPQGFKPDQSDRLRVDASGSNFAFYVNDELMTKVSDSEFASGQAGFYAETFDETLAHVHFDALTIRELAEEVVIAAAPTAETEAPSPTEPPVAEASPADTVEPSQATPVSDTLPAQAPAESPTPTQEPTPTATPEPPTPTTAAIPEGMVLIPAGSFMMGSATGQLNEAPPHEVSLDAFFIDKFEVSNADYRQCVEAGGCSQTGSPAAFTRPGYRDDPTYSNYPVISVTWEQARTYCRWAGKRLPSEAEWEYAARGPDNLTWPWGNTFDPNLSAASTPDTQAVDSFPAGASPFGIYNMAGNVSEWVQDIFDANYYANSPAQNPVNTGSGGDRVHRGGSFANEDGAFYTTSRRYNKAPSSGDVDIGFRCALDGS